MDSDLNTNSNMDNSTYTVLEVAHMMRVHVMTIRRWIKAGKLKAVKMYPRSRPRIPAEEIKRLLEGKNPCM